MLDRAAVALGLGETVILDGSWTDRRWREEASAVADRTHSKLVELCCAAPTALAAERMRHRRAGGGDPSDATPAVAATMATTMSAWPEAAVIDTFGTPEATLARVVRMLTVVMPTS